MRFKRGDAVCVKCPKHEGDTFIGKVPTRGTVVYKGRRFIVVEMLSDGGGVLYRETFWPGEVSAWEDREGLDRTR